VFDYFIISRRSLFTPRPRQSVPTTCIVSDEGGRRSVVSTLVSRWPRLFAVSVYSMTTKTVRQWQSLVTTYRPTIRGLWCAADRRLLKFWLAMASSNAVQSEVTWVILLCTYNISELRRYFVCLKLLSYPLFSSWYLLPSEHWIIKVVWVVGGYSIMTIPSH